MLTKQDNVFNIYYIACVSRIGIFPLEVKVNSGNLTFRRGFGPTTIFICHLALVQCHIIWSIILAVRKFKKYGNDALPTASLDYVFVAGIETCIIVGAVMFLQYPDVTCEIFNSCGLDKPEVKSPRFYRQSRGWLNWKCRYSFIELIVILLPFAAVNFGVAFCIVSAYIRTLPATKGAPFSIQCLAIAFDVVTTFSWVPWMYFMILVQILLIEKVNHVINKEMDRVKSGSSKRHQHIFMRNMKLSYSIVRQLQIELNLFNRSQSGIICVFRAVITGVAVVCGSTAIKFFHDHPFIGFANCLCNVYGSVFYMVMYNNGFKLPISVLKWKRLLLQLTKSSVPYSRWDAYALKQLRFGVNSVCTSTFGVQVGFFYYLQRRSTPNFIDFNIKNTVRLVVAFSKRV